MGIRAGSASGFRCDANQRRGWKTCPCYPVAGEPKLHHGPDRRTQFPAVPRIAGNAATPGRLGYPGETELAQTLDDYVDGILRNALSIAVETAAGNPVPVIGYCMGGTLATALAVLEPEKCGALVLLALHLGIFTLEPGGRRRRSRRDGLSSKTSSRYRDAYRLTHFNLCSFC